MNDTDATHGISHDKVFKTLFRQFFKDLVELVHPEIAGELVLEDPEFLDAPGFADLRKYGHVTPDLLAKVATRSGEPRIVLAHVETEARFKTAMDVRMEEYFMHLTLEYHCPVISIAVFLQGGSTGVERREVVRRVGAWVCNRFNYLAFSLSRGLAEEYVDRPQPLAAALAALMHSEIWNNLERRLRCLQAIGRADVSDKERFLLAKVVDTYIQLGESERKRYEAELEHLANKEVREMVITWEEALAESRAQGIAKGEAQGIAKGEAQGIAKGEAQGIAKGEAQGRCVATREAIVLLLNRRFSPVPPATLEKLEAIDDLSRLHHLLEQALDARSLGDLDL